MTYHCFPITVLSQDEADEPRQRVVHDREEHGEDEHHHDDDGRGARDLAPARPAHAAELDQYVVKELPNLLQSFHSPSATSEGATTTPSEIIWQTRPFFGGGVGTRPPKPLR